MDHLASCYFCGTALDETLRDYRVVPVELRDTDEATTATLCQSCHGKLERLLSPVVEAAGEDGATLDARPARERRGGGDAATAGATGADEAEGGTDVGGDATESVDPIEKAAEAAESGEAAESADADGGGDEDETPLADVEANLVDIDEEPLAEGDEAGSSDPLAESGDDADADESEGREDQETVRVRHETGDDGGSGETDSDGTESTDTGDEAESEAEAGDGGESEEARTTVSALEYNKVMRLLQNREFPVDREGFERVAANAYELAEHECAEVIDLAIDRGLVAERDGQLVRPD